MDVTVDKYGRIILPKSLRQILGLTPGRKVNIQVADGSFVATPVQIFKSVLVEEGHLSIIKLVDKNGVEKEREENFDFDNVLKQVRDERIDKFLKSFE